MSPFKPADSPYWSIDYVDATGKRVRRSSRSRSKAVAEKMEDEERVRAEAARRGLMPTTVNHRRWTVAQGLEWWCTTITPTLVRGEDTAAVARKHIGPAPFAGKQLEAVTPGEITAWLRGLGSALSARSVNHVRAHLSGVYSRLRAEGIFEGANPVALTRPAVVEAAAPRSLPVWYAVPLLEHAPTDGWRLAFAVAAYTGMRQGEILRVFGRRQWHGVDLDARIVTLTRTKRKNIRRVALHAELVAILRDALDRHVELPTASAFTKAPTVLRNTLDRADIDDTHATFHGLRGMWVSHMMSRPGVSSDVVRYMKDGPRSSSVIETHYLQWPDHVLLREIDLMPPWPRREVRPFARARRTE